MANVWLTAATRPLEKLPPAQAEEATAPSTTSLPNRPAD